MYVVRSTSYPNFICKVDAILRYINFIFVENNCSILCFQITYATRAPGV